jgi:5-methylcytosine-specific restriction protein A
MYADHVVELKEGGSLLDLRNGQCLCGAHHQIKTVETKRFRNAWSGSISYPHLPKPTCRVMLVCGPPAAGKSTYVRDHAVPGDIVIDLDTIARQLGMGRHRPDAARILLLERNQRLAALAHEPGNRTAWVIVSAPNKRTRQWWCSALGVMPNDMVLLVPTRTELCQRVKNDPDRQDVIDLHLQLIDRWLARELGVAEIYSNNSIMTEIYG